MQVFHVPVRNELTGEVRVVEISCGHEVDAQVEALHDLFHNEGWRHAKAMTPEACLGEPAA